MITTLFGVVGLTLDLVGALIIFQYHIRRRRDEQSQRKVYVWGAGLLSLGFLLNLSALIGLGAWMLDHEFNLAFLEMLLAESQSR